MRIDGRVFAFSADFYHAANVRISWQRTLIRNKIQPLDFELPQIVRTIRKKPPVVEDIKF